tara:strand:+ start:349 stop:960 length:612 start_codon:yes stop_codon:yes gene_type:complete
MKILSTEFVKGVVGEDAVMYDGTPHIAFIGRSNVGKSSTLNALLERKKLVKTGNTPGKTREINFFRITTDNAAVSYFVDLPGYGYAKLSKTERSELQKMIEWYITHPQADTALICLIIDAKVGLTDSDKQFISMMKDSNKDYIIAVNKIDKINQKTQHQLNQSLIKELPTDKIFYYSAATKKNIHHLQDFLFKGEEVKEGEKA